ncbi:helix-turn-helix domain-containing protein [Granulicatella elegans]|nr:helix-turn-helix domain-containing protein [Granulicatella elegans]UEA31196.1 helix-turn-helix domain-containing protein [Granulicatella elegans]
MSAIIKKENLIGINEAAEFLEVKPATIRDLIRKGKDILRRKIGKV